jgi:sec-independent protein translocase protein TatB
MFGIDSSEFLLIAVVALIVIGPKDLPRVMRLVGGWVGRGKAMTRHLRSGFDTMMREAELEEMQKQWAKQNADIMAATNPADIGPHSFDPIDPAFVAPAHDAVAMDEHDRVEDGAAPHAMTGPQPSPIALAHPTEPAIPLEPVAHDTMPTAQP